MSLHRNMRILPAAAAALAITAGATACKEEDKVTTASSIKPDRMPTMTTRNVSTLISDSGITQYKIVAPLWKVYEEVDTPHWVFPQGLYLQKYDPAFRVIASVAADSATYLSEARLWRLDGHVEIRKIPGDIFLSERFFWDTKRHIMYSDTFIHIETKTHVLEGTGFESNEHLTDYRIVKPQGIFPVDRDAFGDR